MKLVPLLKYEYLKTMRSRLLFLLVFLPMAYSLYVLHYGLSAPESEIKVAVSHYIVFRILTDMFSLVPFAVSLSLAYLVHQTDVSGDHVIFLIGVGRRVDVALSKVIYTLLVSAVVGVITVVFGVIGGLLKNNLGDIRVTLLYAPASILSIAAPALLYSVLMLIFGKYALIGLLAPFLLSISSYLVFLTGDMPAVGYCSLFPVNLLLLNYCIMLFYKAGSERLTLNLSITQSVSGRITLPLTVEEIVIYTMISLALYIAVCTIMIMLIYKHKDFR